MPHPSRLGRNLIANYLAQGWVAVVGLLFVPVYIRYLGIEAYGIIGLFALLQSILVLLDLGMTPTLGREMARFTGGASDVAGLRDLLRSIEVVSIGLATLVALCVWAASPWLATSWLRSDGVPPDVLARVIAIMGVVAALRFVEPVYRASMIGLQQQVQFNIISSVLATARALGAVAVLAFVANTIVAFFVWQGVISLITVSTLALATYKALPGGRAGRFSTAALRRIAGFALGMLGITLLSLLLTQVDKLLLSRLLTLSEYGHYTLATAVSSLLVTLVGPIVQALSPRLAQLHAARDEAGFALLYHQSAQLVSVTVGSAAVMLIVFADTILRLWTRDPGMASETAPVLRLLTLGYLLNVVMIAPYQAQLAHGWTGLMVKINVVAVLLIVPALWWAVPRYGPVGAAAAWAGLNAAYVLIVAQFMHRRILLHEKTRWYIHDLIAPLAGPVALALLVRALVPIDALPALAQIAILACVGAAVLTAACLGSNHILARVIRALRDLHKHP